MAKHREKNTTEKMARKSRTPVITDYSSHSTPKSTKSTFESSFSDELIISLANKYENRRAQQVTKWESIQRKTLSKAA